MLRALVALLILANLVFFAWSSGALSPWLFDHAVGESAQREPQRARTQVRPESIRIVGESAVPSADRTACYQAGPFNEVAVQAAETALRRADLPLLDWQREAAASGQWWLRLPRATAEQRAAIQLLSEPALSGGFVPCN